MKIRTTGYRLPRSVYFRTALQVSLIKTAWYSARFQRPIIIGRGSRVYVARSARLEMAPGSFLALGLFPTGSAGAGIELRPRSVLRIDGLVQLARGARIMVNWDADLGMSGGTVLNEGALLDCDEQIRIGPVGSIGRDAVVTDTDGHRIVRDDSIRTKPVSLGARCWLGHGAMVLKGVSLGEGCVVAAGSIVTHDSPGGRLLVGAPARDIGPIEWAIR